jgi:hypothetical protein
MRRKTGSLIGAVVVLDEVRHTTVNRVESRVMNTFHSGREAKEFLISRIVAEARRENVPLSEVERKMLYFSESGWTLPDMMSVSDDFDREYDQDEYEKKIARLVRKADAHARKEPGDEYDGWRAAIRFLKTEDHYILVMVGIAGLRPAGDQLKLFGAGLGIAMCVLLTSLLSIKYKIDPSRHVPSASILATYILEAAVCVVIAFLLFRFVVGRKKADDLTSKVLERLVRIYQRAR